jgi:hypothetical protein
VHEKPKPEAPVCERNEFTRQGAIAFAVYTREVLLLHTTNDKPRRINVKLFANAVTVNRPIG